MLSKLKVSRRFALRGAVSGVGVSLWLPVFEAMCNRNGTAFAQGSPLPTSFGIFFWGNGVHRQDWTPTATGNGNAWQLSRNLGSFAALKDAMTLVTGLNMLDGKFKGHGWGALYVLAGGDGFPCVVTSDIGRNPIKGETDKSTQSDPTIDQIIAKAIGTGYPFASLETGVLPYRGIAMGTVSKAIAHRGPYDFTEPERDPKALFNRLFGAVVPGVPMGNTPSPTDISNKLRRSVLDAVIEDGKRLRMSLGSEDGSRLDRHMESVRAIEQRIARVAPVLAPGMSPAPAGNCTKPPVPTDPVDMTQRSKSINRMVAMALACNLTRVYSHLWSGARDDNTYPTIGINANHHDLTHAGKTTEHSSIEGYIMSQYADMAMAMKETPMGAGTVLDNTLIYGISDLSEPGGHIMADYHIVLMGHAGGKVPGNRHVRLPGRKVTELMLTLMQLMGLKIDTFGTWDKTSKTMPEILG